MHDVWYPELAGTVSGTQLVNTIVKSAGRLAANKSSHRSAYRFANLDVVTICSYNRATRFEWDDYGETRYITLGLLRTHVIVVVHTERKDAIRIISARKATKYETKTYFEHVAN